MPIQFEHHFREKVMEQAFSETTHLDSVEAVRQWKTKWTEALKSWHSPYKTLIDCTNLSIRPEEEVLTELARMFQFFRGLFLKKAVAFGGTLPEGVTLPWDWFPSEEEARKSVGLDKVRSGPLSSDFRSQIQIDNNFRQHVVEISFASPVVIDSKEKLAQLRGKLTNNLMQWHSSWNLFIDCHNVEFSKEIQDEFDAMVRFFRGLFLASVAGYHPKHKDAFYPFTVYRARHKAVLELEKFLGATAGDDANCRSRKSSLSSGSESP